MFTFVEFNTHIIDPEDIGHRLFGMPRVFLPQTSSAALL